MAKIFKAGGSGRKKRGFKGTIIPESLATLQQTKDTLQGMQTVADERRSQARDKTLELASRRSLVSSQANFNVTQSQQNARTLSNAQLRDYQTGVLGDQAKKARLTFEQQQQKELMALIKQVPNAIEQVSQLRTKAAAEWLSKKQLYSIDESIHDSFRFHEKEIRARDAYAEEWAQSHNLDPIHLENLKRATGMRGILLQENSMRANAANPLKAKESEKNYFKILPDARKAEITAARNALTLGDGNFSKHHALTLRTFRRQAKDFYYKSLDKFYTASFKRHNARDIFDEHYDLDIASINIAEIENAGIRNVKADSDELFNITSEYTLNGVPDKERLNNPNTKKPYSSATSEYLHKGGQFKPQTEKLDAFYLKAAQQGVIRTTDGRELPFSLAEIHQLSKQKLDLPNGQTVEYGVKFPQKIQQLEKAAGVVLQNELGKRSNLIASQSHKLIVKVRLAKVSGAPLTTNQIHKELDKLSNEVGGLSQSERYSLLGIVHENGRDLLPPDMAQQLYDTKEVKSDYKAVATGVQNYNPRVNKASMEWSSGPVSDNLDNFILKVTRLGTDQRLVASQGDSYKGDANALLYGQKIRKRMISEFNEIAGNINNTDNGSEIMQRIVEKYDGDLENNKGLFQLNLNDDGNPLKYHGRGYAQDYSLSLENLGILNEVRDNPALLYSRDNSHFPARITNAVERHIRYGDPIPKVVEALDLMHPLKSKYEIMATMVESNNPDSDLFNEKGGMVIPGHYGIVYALDPSDEERRILNDRTPSTNVAISLSASKYAGIDNISETFATSVIAEGYINPKVGGTYNTTNERFNALFTSDGLHQAKESILKKDLSDTTVGELLQNVDYFKTALDTEATDFIRSLKKGTIDLDSKLTQINQSRVWQDKSAFDSGVFALNEEVNFPIGQERFNSSSLFNPERTLRGDLRNIISTTAKVSGKIGKALAKQIGKEFKALVDEGDKLTGGLYNPQEWEKLIEQGKAIDAKVLADFEKEQSTWDALSAKRRRELKSTWNYLTRPAPNDQIFPVIEALENSNINTFKLHPEVFKQVNVNYYRN